MACVCCYHLSLSGLCDGSPPRCSAIPSQNVPATVRALQRAFTTVEHCYSCIQSSSINRKCELRRYNTWSFQ